MAFRASTIGTTCVGLDELAYSGFAGRDTDVLAHEFILLFVSFGDSGHSRMAFGSRNASMPYLPYSRPTPEYLNPPQGACGSSVMLLITTRPARSWEATQRARWMSLPKTAEWRPYLESLAMRMASSSAS